MEHQEALRREELDDLLDKKPRIVMELPNLEEEQRSRPQQYLRRKPKEDPKEKPSEL